MNHSISETKNKLDINEIIEFTEKNPHLTELMELEVLFDETSFTVDFLRDKLLNKQIDKEFIKNNKEFVELFLNLSPIHKCILLTMLYIKNVDIFELFNSECIKYISKDIHEFETN